MFAILYALGMAVADLFKSRARLEAEILLLRHQLNVALRHAPPRGCLLQSNAPASVTPEGCAIAASDSTDR
jgi:hypothetical protein